MQRSVLFSPARGSVQAAATRVSRESSLPVLTGLWVQANGDVDNMAERGEAEERERDEMARER